MLTRSCNTGWNNLKPTKLILNTNIISATLTSPVDTFGETLPKGYTFKYGEILNVTEHSITFDLGNSELMVPMSKLDLEVVEEITKTLDTPNLPAVSKTREFLATPLVWSLIALSWVGRQITALIARVRKQPIPTKT